MTLDLVRTSAVELARAVRERTISSVELTEQVLRRIGERNQELGAFVSVFGPSALRQARRIDASKAPRGLFAGVPVGIKDLEPVRGSVMRAGSKAIWVWSPVDGPATRRIRKAEGVIIGKLATSELAIMPVTETDIHPPARNPWNPAMSSGGSSGGSSAAVASGMIPIAHASDGAGSIRIPAALCHLFGFKPSRGTVDNFYGRIDSLSTSATGSISHTVEDAAAMIDVLRGRPFALDDAQSYLHRHRERPRRLKVGICVDSPLVDVRPVNADAVRKMAATLEGMGHDLVEAPPMDLGTVADFLPIMQRLVANVPMPFRASLQPISRWMHVAGGSVSKSDARRRFLEFERRVLAWFGDLDVLVTPTIGVRPPRVGELVGEDPKEVFQRATQLGVFTAAFNLSGQPAASVPAGLDDEGMPLGVQLIGRVGHDLEVLQVARSLEDAVPWVGVRPIAA